MGRLKTGTPPRLRAGSIDFAGMSRLEGDPRPRPFSWRSPAGPREQVSCFVTHTNPATHQLIKDNLHLSPLYNGSIQGISARYCPSLEDKVMRFADKSSHQVTLEPEGRDTAEIYAKGLGNCLPVELQLELFRSVPGLEEVEVMRPAYAIEYDYVDPLQLQPTLETKLIKGLFLAGQINGTSGYEEAAGQGLWAGINAACQVLGRAPFLPHRSQAYMAVLVDDLVTRGTREPYRLFTSRAEYRLLLREDNADQRLTEWGHELGLVGREALDRLQEKQRLLQEEEARLAGRRLYPSAEVNAALTSRGSAPLKEPTPFLNLVKRPQLDLATLYRLAGEEPPVPAEVMEQLEIQHKYEGYIRRQEDSAKKFAQGEGKRIPPDFDYDGVSGLSLEVREKLQEVRPRSLGQAARISGVTPAALAILMVYLKRGGKKNLRTLADEASAVSRSVSYRKHRLSSPKFDLISRL